MKKYFISCILILIHFSVFSQHYSTLYTDKQALYVNTYWEDYHYYGMPKGFTGISLDSVKVIGSDTVCYHFNILRRNSETTDCSYLKKNPNWTGRKTILKSNGENIFLTNSGDSLRILTKASVNDKWHFYDFPNGNYFEATLISKYSGTTLSLPDSIKLLSITLKDNSGNPVAHDFNEKELLLSKNFGMVKTYDLSRFPNDTSAFILIGISDPAFGKQNITAREIFDYNIGDEFHIETNSSININYGRTFTQEKRIVLSKNISLNQDTLIYQIERILVTQNYNYQAGTHDTTAVKDTITERNVVSEWPGLNAMPLELISTVNYYRVYSLEISGYNNRLVKSESEGLNGMNDPCYDEIIGIGFPSYYFLEGLGVYYETYNSYPNQNYKRLIYYKKGSETYGTPLTFNFVLSLHAGNKPQLSSSVFPNPFTDFTLLKINNSNQQTYHLVLMDVYGKIVKEYDFNDDQLLIRNEGNLKGLYIYKLFNEKNEVGTGKLVIYRD